MFKATQASPDSALFHGMAAFAAHYSAFSLRLARRTAQACLLTLMFAAAPVVAVAEPQPPVQEAGAAEDSEADGDDEPATEDDGSSRLKGKVRNLDPDAFTPLSAAEEEALLGNWGDSENEDED